MLVAFEHLNDLLGSLFPKENLSAIRTADHKVGVGAVEVDSLDCFGVSVAFVAMFKVGIFLGRVGVKQINVVVAI